VHVLYMQCVILYELMLSHICSSLCVIFIMTSMYLFNIYTFVVFDAIRGI